MSKQQKDLVVYYLMQLLVAVLFFFLLPNPMVVGILGIVLTVLYYAFFLKYFNLEKREFYTYTLIRINFFIYIAYFLGRFLFPSYAYMILLVSNFSYNILIHSLNLGFFSLLRTALMLMVGPFVTFRLAYFLKDYVRK